MSETQKLRNILVKIRGYKQGLFDQLAYFDTLNTPNDAILGASINKAIHDKQVDYIKIRIEDKVTAS
jgi:hypothetical protein